MKKAGSGFRLFHFLYGILVVLFLFISLDSLRAQSTTPSTRLEFAKPLVRAIENDQSHIYQVALTAGQYASIDVEQHGADVLVKVFAPSGKQLFEHSASWELTGTETATLVAEVTGDYLLKVELARKQSGGNYEIHWKELRLAEAKDMALHQARLLRREGLQLHNAVRFAEAVATLEKALKIFERELGTDNLDYAFSLSLLANSISRRGEFAQATKLHLQAIALNKKYLGENHPAIANLKNQLGTHYFQFGDYLNAEIVLNEALAIYERTLGKEHLKLVSVLNQLATVHINKGDFNSAEKELFRALSIAERFSLDSDEESVILGNLGYFFVTKQEYVKAEPYVRRSLVLLEKLSGADDPALAEAFQNLAIIAKEKGDYAEALVLSGKAAVLKERSVGFNHIDLLAILNNRANIYKALRDYEKACEEYLRILQIAEKSGGPNHRTTMTIIGNLANAYAAKGDLTNALKYQKRVDAIIENNILMNLTIGSERQKLAHLDLMAQRTERTISLSLGLGAQEKEARELAALVVLQRKGRALDAMTNGLMKLRERANPADQVLLDQLNTVRSQIARLSLAGPQKISLEEHQQKIKELEAQKEKLEADISQRNLEFRTQIQPVTLAAVQAAIPANAALLEFTIYRPFNPGSQGNSTAYGLPHYAVFVLHHGGSIEAKDLGEVSVIDEAIGKLRAALRNPAQKDFRALARDVDEKVMQPLRTFLPVKHLILSPDGALNLIPFESLVDEQNHFLIENYTLSYLSSGRDLMRLNVSRNTTHPGVSVIVADPAFGESEISQVQTNTLISKRRSVVTSKDLNDIYFAPLSATAPEANAIRTQFPDALLLSGINATEAGLKQVLAPRILHIATHGFFLTDDATTTNTQDTRAINAKTKIENPLLRSGLALAGANLHKSDKEDGILTALEASGLNLWGTKLVTLSACDTGIGEVKNGEGVYGLRRAFVLAGTESLVMSLWPVSDYVTRELMTNYYKGLKLGLGRCEALRQAQLKMLKRQSRAHPFYWASFIQSGEWANLDGKR